MIELLLLLGLGGLVWLAKRSNHTRPLTAAAAMPAAAQPAAPPPSRESTSETPTPDPCMEWTNRASALAVKPDGSRITDSEARQLEDFPLLIIPNAYVRAANTWARGAGRPPES